MYKKNTPNETNYHINESYVGETIETKIRRIVDNKEPITDGAPLIYTERKKGVEPQYDIRTDRFEIAIEAMDLVNKTHQAKREERQKLRDEKNKTPDGNGGGNGSTPATEKQ
jgi:hypothetical protein